MNSNVAKGLSIVGLLAIAPILAYLAYSRPGYFISHTYIEGLLFFELLCAAVWLYRRVFFAVVIIAFLLAGVDLPVGSVWTMARWVVLGVGALVGLTLTLKERRFSFGLFHLLAIFSVLAALVSAAVSRYTSLSFLKVLSLLLLFIYAATGARIAVFKRENRFFTGLLLGCEIFVAVVGGFYLFGREVMGNPNSLGAVMGVVAVPILLWSTLLKQDPLVHRRRMLLFVVATYLTFASHARAGILAAGLACALLCVALRRYNLLIRGIGIVAILVAASAILQPEAFSRTLSSLTSTMVFKGKDPAEGLLGSRESPWQDAMDSIHQHFWFGTGFGTSDTGQDVTENIGKYASSTATSTEHGSSYLAILSWVGMMGILPFGLLLGLLFSKIIRVFFWMHKTTDALHPAVPLAVVMFAGLIHATFEDWLFAPGYYLCAFYWSMAFVFVDQLATLPSVAPDAVSFAQSRITNQEWGVTAPSQ